jgi:hypothetical protein
VLAARVTEGRLQAAVRKAQAARRVRAGYQRDGRRLARERGTLYASGCMLYWAEGAKGRNAVQISNSDPELLSLFVRFLRDHFGVEDNAFRIHCHLFTDHLDHQREVEQFWLEQLGLTSMSLRKSVVNTYSKYSQKKRANKLPYGTCKLVVYSTRIVQTIFPAPSRSTAASTGRNGSTDAPDHAQEGQLSYARFSWAPGTRQRQSRPPRPHARSGKIPFGVKAALSAVDSRLTACFEPAPKRGLRQVVRVLRSPGEPDPDRRLQVRIPLGEHRRRIGLERHELRHLLDRNRRDSESERPLPRGVLERRTADEVDHRLLLFLVSREGDRSLVDRPDVAELKVVAGADHPLPREHARVVPVLPLGGLQPVRPRSDADLGHRVELRPETVDDLRLLRLPNRPCAFPAGNR